jgi:hypothetical protein
MERGKGRVKVKNGTSVPSTGQLNFLPSETVAQLVIPAKSRGLSGEALAKTEGGCEPGSRMF